MPKSSERSRSVWKDTAPLPQFPPLTDDTTADVCVVGAGIAGITTAYLLAREGRDVIVLDANAVGGGETGQTTAHLSSALDDRYFNIERMHGREGARLAYHSHQAAIERIGEIAATEGIDCDYARLDGYLFLTPDDTVELLDRERDAAHRAGFTDVERVDRAPMDPFDTGPCLRFPRQARFHPLRYLEGLVGAIRVSGGRIFTGTHVDEISGHAPARVRARNGSAVTTEHVVVATNSPFVDRVAVHTKQAPYRTFVIGARVPAGAVPDLLLYDTLDPYHYVRLQRVENDAGTRDLLIVGGEDHKTGHADDADQRYARLEAWTRARFPIQEVEFRWSGQVMEPVDGMAFIGRNPLDPEVLASGGTENLYIVTGDSGHGMTHGTIAGILLSDLIPGRENPWARLYDPSRVTLGAGSLKEFARENLDVAKEYTEWVRGAKGEVDSVDQIAPGKGAIIRRGGTPVAAYRDDGGTLHERSAVCTHLGCIVHWNSEERSWDCPCHGSRFDPTGEVLNGPAPVALQPAEPEARR